MRPVKDSRIAPTSYSPELPCFSSSVTITTQQQPQLSPRHARRPSTTRIGIAARAATVSTQRTCQTAKMISPARVEPARYAQVADCVASAARARLLILRASRRFILARRGMAIKASAVIAIPIRLVPISLVRPSQAIAATTTASKNNRTPAALAARALFNGNPGMNCSSTTMADSNSTALSDPNASKAMLCARAAAHSDAPHSTVIHAIVTHCSHRTVADGWSVQESQHPGASIRNSDCIRRSGETELNARRADIPDASGAAKLVWLRPPHRSRWLSHPRGCWR